MLLAVRAQVLVSPRSRRRDAETLGDVVRRASGPAVTRSPRTPLNRKAVGDCAAGMAEVGSRLSAPGPVSARGVALVGRLLCDGTGPLYNRRLGRRQLEAALRDIMVGLGEDLVGPGTGSAVGAPSS